MVDLRKFSGRGTDQAATDFIMERILTELAIKTDDKVVDIGCGDGTLLRLALRKGAGNVVGLAGTEQETELLRAVGLNVDYGRTDSLPIPDQFASVVVCNSVLHIVPAENIPTSLREIARITQPGARIWIGELPRFREPASIRSFSGIPAMLWWLLRRRGVRTFVGMCRQLLTGAQKGATLRTPQAFWAEPHLFTRMAADAGLKVEREASHQHLNAEGQLCTSPARHDYLLVREI